MSKTIEYVLNIDVNKSVQSMSAMKSELREVSKAMQAAADAGNSAAYDKLSKRFIDLRDQAEDLNAKLQPLDKQIGVLTQGIGQAVSIGSNLATVFGADSKSAEQLFKTFAKAQAITNVVNGFNQLIDQYPKMIAGFKSVGLAMKAAFATNPVFLIITAVATLAAGIGYLVTRQKEAVEEFHKLTDVQKEVVKGTINEYFELRKLQDILHSNTATYSEKRKALDDIKKIMPDYNAELSKEGVLLNENTNAIRDYVQALYAKIRLQVAEKEVEASIKKQLETAIKLREIFGGDNGVISIYDNFSRTMKDVSVRIDEVSGRIQVFTEFEDMFGNVVEGWTEINDSVSFVDENIRGLVTTYNQAGREIDKVINSAIGGTIQWGDVVTKTGDVVVREVLETNEIMINAELNYNSKLKDIQKSSIQDRLLLLKQELLYRTKDALETKDIITKTIQDEINFEKLSANQQFNIIKELYVNKKIEKEEYYKWVRQIEEKRIADLQKQKLKEIQIEFEKQSAVLSISKTFVGLIGQVTKENADLQAAAAIFETGIDLARVYSSASAAAAEAGAETGVAAPIVTPLVLAEMLAIALPGIYNAYNILSQSKNFARGGIIGGMYDGTDNQQINAMPGEAIINRSATHKYAPILSYINQSTGGKEIGGGSGSLIDYELLASKINDKRVVMVTSDVTSAQNKQSKIKTRAILK